MHNTAIKVENLSKHFRVPHEKHNTLKSTALNIFSSRKYSEFTALNDVSFEIKKGEFFGIIGPNGSGKSTLLKILAGIYMSDHGKIEIDGDLSPFLELGVGFNPELTARENVFLGGSILGLSRKEINEKFQNIVDFAELEEFIDMKFKNFSSGMQVRLAFSLAINAHAEILLMDEVLAVGDTNFQSKCIDEFKKYKREGKTVVLVTHDIGTVQRYCDRVMLLKSGKILTIDTPLKAIDKYIESISDNISDKSSSDINRMHTGKGDLKINKASFSKGNKQVATFKSNEIIEFTIDLDNRTNLVSEIVIGLEVFDAVSSHVIYGYHTGMDNIYFKVDRNKDFFIVRIANNNLLEGSYYINLGIADKKTSIQFDYLEKACTFRVLNSLPERNYSGEVDLGANISKV